MDSDFQAHYLTAEQAYGAGDFRTAQSITVDLLGQLNGMAETDADRDALLAWRAFVALLAGNIHLYGLNEPDQARGFFELVLASHPQDTLKDLAEQGLERIHGRQENPAKAVAPPPTPASPPTSTLIQDPFLTQPTTFGFTGGLDPQQTTRQASATPWLDAPTAPDTDTSQVQSPLTTAPVAINEDVVEEEEVANAVAEADAEPTPVIEVQARPEPDDMIEADVIQGPEPVPEPEQPTEQGPALVVSPSIRQRLEQGRLQVTLPTQQKPPSEPSSDSGQTSSRWSWLKRRSGRS
ncbi:tol-pal system YbgF family protein [Synechococcus sp. A15-60]|uniref:tetratricopeptide repeat protein n=1 Tax=Synechococcus sp. A15-60 TaxID=1050655 RepID=UPI00164419AF|nr:hypothetical protein [Synechococcus sp. A15-60]QNI46773.1 hypothetical protein SynA1560_00073 [Synechococcus sp. A15-60]